MIKLKGKPMKAIGILALAGAFAMGVKVREVMPFALKDIQSEVKRVPSKGHPKNWESFMLEGAKTVKEVGLYTYNTTLGSLFDKIRGRRERKCVILVDKSTNTARLYALEPRIELLKEFRVATALIDKPHKTRFGEYVTPNAAYVVVHKLDSLDLTKKFRRLGKQRVWDLYGDGMLELLGPWAPYIAIHATPHKERIGRRATHGCVNVSLEVMRELLDIVDEGSYVIIYDGREERRRNMKKEDVIYLLKKHGLYHAKGN